MTFDQFVSVCRDFGSAPDDQLLLDELYKAEGWNAEDRRRLCLLHRALETLEPFGPDPVTNEDQEKALDYWWDLPGREELKLEAWRQVFFEGPCRKFEAMDINQLSPEAREFYFELLDGMRDDATAFALGVVPGSDEWRKFLAGERLKGVEESDGPN